MVVQIEGSQEKKPSIFFTYVFRLFQPNNSNPIAIFKMLIVDSCESTKSTDEYISKHTNLLKTCTILLQGS